MKIFQALARPFVVFVERYYPDAFIFVIILSVITFFSSIFLTDSSATSTLFAWSFGLIIGAIVAKSVASECYKKPFKIHYPLLVASAYSGFVIWHMGYSSSAALFVATPGHLLEDKIGVIPVTETILSLPNIVLALMALAIITIICPLMRPKDTDVIELNPNQLLKNNNKNLVVKKNNLTVIEKFENHRSLNIFLGLTMVTYIFMTYFQNGFSLNLDIVSWTFLAFGLLLASSPMHFIKLVNNAASTLGPIILQYPFYSGIMGMMATTGLMKVITDWIVSIASPETLGFFAFLSGGLVNMFIPSGGGQWAVQGPIMIEAAQSLGVNPSIVVLGVAYGDQWSNMIQPFWTIPILAIAGLHMRQILGYTFVIFLMTGLLYGSGMLFMGSGNI